MTHHHETLPPENRFEQIIKTIPALIAKNSVSGIYEAEIMLLADSEVMDGPRGYPTPATLRGIAKDVAEYCTNLGLDLFLLTRKPNTFDEYNFQPGTYMVTFLCISWNF